MGVDERKISIYPSQGIIKANIEAFLVYTEKEFNKTHEMLKTRVQGKKLLKYAKNKVKKKKLGLNFGIGRRKISYIPRQERSV